MSTRKLLVVGGLTLALAVPAGVAVAATSTPSPEPGTTQQGGPGYGRMMGGGMGHGDPEDCPYYNSADMQKWREQRAERQAEMQKLHGDNWTPPRDGTGPFHDQAPGARARTTAS